MKYLRFDTRNERSRNKNDVFVHIRDIFETFTGNFIVHFVPYPYVTVDEQLVPMKNKCKIIQYIPSKPDKFGIKIWMLACNKTKYRFNQFPYLGAIEKDSRNGERLGDFVVKKLANPLFNYGYNITCDSLFTSISLSKFLLEKKTTIVGTVRMNSRFLSDQHKKKLSLYDSEFFINNSQNLISVAHQSKKKTKVVLLSTQHQRTLVNPGQKKKPEIVEFYNQTKSGVDLVDEMVKNYTVKSSTRRWSLGIFFDFLDKAGLN